MYKQYLAYQLPSQDISTGLCPLLPGSKLELCECGDFTYVLIGRYRSKTDVISVNKSRLSAANRVYKQKYRFGIFKILRPNTVDTDDHDGCRTCMYNVIPAISKRNVIEKNDNVNKNEDNRRTNVRKRNQNKTADTLNVIRLHHNYNSRKKQGDVTLPRITIETDLSKLPKKKQRRELMKKQRGLTKKMQVEEKLECCLDTIIRNELHLSAGETIPEPKTDYEGDSVPKPNLTKEKLDEELDQMYMNTWTRMPGMKYGCGNPGYDWCYD